MTTMTGSRPLPLLDEVTPSSLPALATIMTTASVSSRPLAAPAAYGARCHGPDRRAVVAGDGPPDVRQRHGRAARGDLHLPAARPRRGDPVPHGGGRARGRGLCSRSGAGAPRVDQAMRQGHRASIAEEERPGVFTLRVGNLMPGDVATVELHDGGRLAL